MGLTGETGVPDLPIIKAASTSTVTISVLEIFSSYKCQINKLTNSLFYYSRFSHMNLHCICSKESEDVRKRK